MWRLRLRPGIEHKVPIFWRVQRVVSGLVLTSSAAWLWGALQLGVAALRRRFAVRGNSGKRENFDKLFLSISIEIKFSSFNFKTTIFSSRQIFILVVSELLTPDYLKWIFAWDCLKEELEENMVGTWNYSEPAYNSRMSTSTFMWTLSVTIHCIKFSIRRPFWMKVQVFVSTVVYK